MSDEKTFQVLTGCQIQECAEETSYRLDMLRWWNGAPLCADCFDEDILFSVPDKDGEPTVKWSDLEPLTIKQARA